MNDIRIEQGERLDILIEDTEAVSAMMLVSTDVGTSALIEATAIFTDGKAQVTLLNTQTSIATGDYVYQIRLYDNAGEYIVLDANNCSGDDCSVAGFKVCPIINEGS